MSTSCPNVSNQYNTKKFIDPARILGLEEGDAHVIRNAGGRAADALHSLVISEQLLGTNTIVTLHHTDCGMLTFTDDVIHEKVKKELSADADHIAFLPFKDLEQSVRDGSKPAICGLDVKSIDIYG